MFKEVMIVAIGIIVGDLALDGIRYLGKKIKHKINFK